MALFVEVSVHSWLAFRQGGVAEGPHRGETVHGRQKAARSKHQETSSNPLFVPYVLSKLLTLKTGSTHTQLGPSHYPLPEIHQVKQWTNLVITHPASHTLDLDTSEKPYL